MSNKSKNVPNREVFSRMNFLYQASVLMAGNNNSLSAYYGALCKNVGKKSVLRMEPEIKRTLCKKCGLTLIPGLTSDIDIDSKNHNLFIIKCNKCHFKKIYKINANYDFWLENPDSVVEIYDFKSEQNKKTNTTKRQQTKNTNT